MDLVSKVLFNEKRKSWGKVSRTIYSLSGISNIGNAKIAYQKYYGCKHINPGQRGNVCKGDLENSHYGVENMLGDIRPGCKNKLYQKY